MLLNDTSTQPPSSNRALLSYCLYSIEGLLIILSNGLIVLTISVHKVLRSRKEYLMLAGLAFGDFWNAWGYLSAGIHRSRMILLGRDTELVTAWHCITRVHCMFWMVGEQLSSCMLLCISLDRLVAVSFPLQYFGFGTEYSYTMLAVFYLYCLAWGGAAFYEVYHLPEVKNRVAICFMSSKGAMPSPAFSFNYWDSWKYTAWMSIFVFLLAILVFKRRNPGHTASSQEQKIQKRFFVTLGLSTLCTLVFFVGMYELLMLLQYISWQLYFSFSPYTDNIKLLNPVMNLVLFTFRHKDIRKGMAFMVRRKELTEAALKSDASAFRKSNKSRNRLPIKGNQKLEEM